MDSLPAVRLALVSLSLRFSNLGAGALTLASIEIIEAAARKANRAVKSLSVDYGGPMPPPPVRPGVEELIIGGVRDFLPGGAAPRRPLAFRPRPAI